MRRLLLTGAALAAALYLLPMFWFWRPSAPGASETVSDCGVGETLSAESASMEQADSTDTSVMTVQIEGKPVEMPLETYVEGVTAAEIPDDFPLEAIRAQAVAARTYAVYKLLRGRPSAHTDADLCDDFRHCAAFRDISGKEGYEHIKQAVRDTAGQILTYEESPIAAVFHCVSGPRTESARDVWGADVPYLQSVVSPGGSAAAQYEGTFTFTAQEFRKIALAAFPKADLSAPLEKWFQNSVRSEAGGVETVELGGVTVEGSAVRDLFDLNSTNFTITVMGDTLTFHTIGYGHGVGLSQYGARYLAEQGWDYTQILAHYYPGTELLPL